MIRYAPLGDSLSGVTVLDLPPMTDSVPAARRFVRTELAGSPADVDTAVLLVSEIVTNAVLHARSPLTLRVEDRAPLARIEVRDGSPVPPRMHGFSTLSATGRGLRLLDRLARAWGVEPETDGKTVWFEIGPAAEVAWEPFDIDHLLEGGGEVGR